jgi:6-phosphogluconate dehydrogenase
MKIGFIGLGRMGSAMVLNLLEHGHEVVVYNRDIKKARELEKSGAIVSESIENLVEHLPERKVVWIMVTSSAVDSLLKEVITKLKDKDIIIDGGNSFYKDSQKRFKMLRKKGIGFLDVGTSGGIEGARHGACMMISGNKFDFMYCESLFASMCVENGYSYFGKSGNGHYVKMVHNGIEYGMMSALAEGLSAIKRHDNKIKMEEVAKVYAHGSIIEGKLAKWLYEGLEDQELKKIKGKVPEGETENEMNELVKESNMKILEESIKMRKNSRSKDSYEGKLISLMRNKFGGHKVNKN